MSEQPPPPRLNYARPGPPPLPPSAGLIGRNFLLGLLGGSVVSAVVWIGGWDAVSKNSTLPGVIYAILGLKVGLAIACIFFPRFRGFGLGLLASLLVGSLIFFGTCTAHVGVI